MTEEIRRHSKGKLHFLLGVKLGEAIMPVVPPSLGQSAKVLSARPCLLVTAVVPNVDFLFRTRSPTIATGTSRILVIGSIGDGG